MPTTVGNHDFVPLLFGGDINVYSMARAFNEAYGIVSAGYGMAKSGVCLDSRILDYESIEAADQPQIIASLISNFCEKHPNQKVLLIPVGDNYIQSLALVREQLPDSAIDFGITLQRFDLLTDKARFFDLCRRYRLSCPDTHVFDSDSNPGSLKHVDIELPWIIKPAKGVDYWQHPFTGQEKVHLIRSRPEAAALIERMRTAGYTSDIIIQGYIPGDDTHMRVLTTYSSSDGVVRLSCMGHVLLEEHTPKGQGNHAVIISEQDLPTELKVRAVLEDLGYTGPANFDFKLDKRDGLLKVFECNVRQGRSSYYVTASGTNLAQVMTEDLIYGRRGDYISVCAPALWLVVPEQVAFDYTPTKPYHEQMHKLIAMGRAVNPLLNPIDSGLKHRTRIQKLLASQPDKFRRFYHREQM
jgi:D-aspartate ligase